MLFADFYIFQGPDGKIQSKKEPKFEDPGTIMGESGLRSHGPKMTPNPGCRVIYIYTNSIYTNIKRLTPDKPPHVDVFLQES